MEKSLNWPLLAVIAVIAAAAGYYAWQSNAPPPPATPVLPAPAPIVAPPTHYAIEPPAAAAAPLPPLDASDAVVAEALAGALNLKSLPALFYPDRMIRRFVATIDNLPRRQAPAAMMPVKPVPGAFAVAGSGEALSIAPANAARYAPYVEFAQRIDAANLVGVYVRFYPLFQQAYEELGYPKGYFNDRLVETIDDLLDAPDPHPPVTLAQPKVLYVYSDSDLESLSAGQKIMIRMGSANAARVKTTLRTLRSNLLQRAPR